MNKRRKVPALLEFIDQRKTINDQIIIQKKVLEGYAQGSGMGDASGEEGGAALASVVREGVSKEPQVMTATSYAIWARKFPVNK